MKLNGFVGKGTGKLGASVFAISGGEQIVRQYNPKVSNPNTDAQLEQRAKLKLMSQIAADMAQSIGFQKNGLVSPRNQFISANIGKCTFKDNEAKIQLSAIDLTPGSLVMPYPSFGQDGAIQLVNAAPANVNTVIYALYDVAEGYRLNLAEQKIVSVAGESRTFPTKLENIRGKQICYVYGVTGSAGAGMVDYEDYEAESAGNYATLAFVRRVILKGGSLTKTAATAHNA